MKYDRAARRAPIKPARTHHNASWRLRDLGPCILASALKIGEVLGSHDIVGKMWQCLCIVQRHGHPPVEECVSGRVPNDENECDNDNNGIVAPTPAMVDENGDAFPVVRAV